MRRRPSAKAARVSTTRSHITPRPSLSRVIRILLDVYSSAALVLRGLLDGEKPPEPRPRPLGRLVAQALPQSWNCKIKEGTQLQRDLTLARVDNADRHRRWLKRLQQSD